MLTHNQKITNTLTGNGYNWHIANGVVHALDPVHTVNGKTLKPVGYKSVQVRTPEEAIRFIEERT